MKFHSEVFDYESTSALAGLQLWRSPLHCPQTLVKRIGTHTVGLNSVRVFANVPECTRRGAVREAPTGAT